MNKLIAALAALLLLAPSALAADSLAPANADDDWLPGEEWVFAHWAPFTEAAVERELGLPAGQLEAFLYDDHRSIAMLVRARGRRLTPVRERLLLPFRGRVSRRQLTVLRDRADRMLTQGHLAQHVYYHDFHGVDGLSAARRIFGVTPDQFFRSRNRGRTPLQIGRRHGRTAASIVAGMDGVLVADHDKGLRTAQSTPESAAEILVRQRRTLPCWVTRPAPGHDRSHPYATLYSVRGNTRTPSPRTVAELRRSAREIERARRARPRSCYTGAPAYRGPQVRPLPRSWVPRRTRRAVAAATGPSRSLVCELRPA